MVQRRGASKSQEMLILNEVSGCIVNQMKVSDMNVQWIEGAAHYQMDSGQ